MPLITGNESRGSLVTTVWMGNERKISRNGRSTDRGQVSLFPILGCYGGADPSIPLPLVEEMRARLRAAPAPGEIVVYANAPHAFFADYRESYREEAARDAFARMLAVSEKQGAA